MKKRLFALFSLCFSLCLLPASLQAAEGSFASQGEQKGPNPVVALSKSIGDMWLLAGGELAGVTEDALDLPGLTDTVSIGSLAHPSTEAVVSLNPELVLMTLDMPGHKTLRQELEALEFPVHVLDIECFADYEEEMLYLTGLTGRADLFEKNVTQVKERIEGILEEAKENLDVSGSFLCMRISATKNRVMKKDFFACEILGDFGLKNIADDSNALDELNLEAIAVADPDWIFVIPMGDDDTALEVYRELFSSQPVWEDLSATQNQQVVILPSELFLYKPNAIWDEAYRYMYDIFMEE